MYHYRFNNLLSFFLTPRYQCTTRPEKVYHIPNAEAQFHRWIDDIVQHPFCGLHRSPLLQLHEQLNTENIIVELGERVSPYSSGAEQTNINSSSSSVKVRAVVCSSAGVWRNSKTFFI